MRINSINTSFGMSWKAQAGVKDSAKKLTESNPETQEKVEESFSFLKHKYGDLKDRHVLLYKVPNSEKVGIEIKDNEGHKWCKEGMPDSIFTKGIKYEKRGAKKIEKEVNEDAQAKAQDEIAKAAQKSTNDFIDNK